MTNDDDTSGIPIALAISLAAALVVALAMRDDGPQAPVPDQTAMIDLRDSELPYCDRESVETGFPCVGYSVGDFMSAIPRPSAGTCPVNWRLWRYDPVKPAICVVEA